MSDLDNRPDPNRTITPGGFHSDSPFARQHQGPQPVDKPKPVTNPEAVVDQKDLEEANHRLLELIDQLEYDAAPVARVANSAEIPLQSVLEDIQGLIYRNLR